MSAFSLNITIIFIAAALFILYWILSRAHFRKQFLQPNDRFIHVPLPHLQKSYSKRTVYGQTRFRQFTISFNKHKDNQNDQNRIIWIVFICGHGDSLDIYDTFINQLYQTLLSKQDDYTNTNTRINIIVYDRIGYGMSSSLNSVINDYNNICDHISPPIFTNISSSDRAMELLSFLMNIEIVILLDYMIKILYGQKLVNCVHI